ncbi:MAG: hypothetical protein VYA34_06115 [Myxococcota bacterium]|nr:hypothetical protein [Myxococcota bacterium]
MDIQPLNPVRVKANPQDARAESMLQPRLLPASREITALSKSTLHEVPTPGMVITETTKSIQDESEGRPKLMPHGAYPSPLNDRPSVEERNFEARNDLSGGLGPVTLARTQEALDARTAIGGRLDSLKSAEARPDVAPVQLEGRELINLPKEVTQPARPIEEVSESEPSAQYAYRPGVFRRATDSYNAVAKNTSFGPPLLP